MHLGKHHTLEWDIHGGRAMGVQWINKSFCARERAPHGVNEGWQLVARHLPPRAGEASTMLWWWWWGGGGMMVSLAYTVMVKPGMIELTKLCLVVKNLE